MMAVFIIAPIFILPCFLIFIYFYQKYFEGNYFLAGIIFFAVFLTLLIIGLKVLKLDERIQRYTATYGYRFNRERALAGLPMMDSGFDKDDNCWDTKADSVSDGKKFILIQTCTEENDTHDAAEQEYVLMGKALSDSTVLYLSIEYNYLTKNYYAETRLGNLKRPSYRIGKLQLFEYCCTHPYKRNQVDSLLSR
jgi:hypothetical protein